MTTIMENKSLEQIPTCSKCDKQLSSPKTLNCTHFFCKNCVVDSSETGNSKQTAAVCCPVCKKFTNSEDVKDMPLVHKLLQTFQQIVCCDHCETTPATLRCVDCPSNYCDKCKTLHDNVPIFQSHQFASVDVSAPQKVIDEVVLCSKHWKEEVKLHCKDCQELVCYVCFLFDEHKNHYTEKIQKALDRIVPQIQESENQLDHCVQVIKEACEKAIHLKNKTQEEFSLFAQKLDDEYEEILKQLQENHSRRKED